MPRANPSVLEVRHLLGSHTSIIVDFYMRMRSTMGWSVSTVNGMTNREPARESVRGISPPKKPAAPPAAAIRWHAELSETW